MDNREYAAGFAYSRCHDIDILSDFHMRAQAPGHQRRAVDTEGAVVAEGDHAMLLPPQRPARPDEQRASECPEKCQATSRVAT